MMYAQRCCCADRDRARPAVQDLAFKAFHSGGVFFAFVVVTQQMQEAVHIGQVRQMVRESVRPPVLLLWAEHNIADK